MLQKQHNIQVIMHIYLFIHFLSHTGDTSFPNMIIRRHSVDIIDAVADVDKLAIDFCSSGLISMQLKDGIIADVKLPRYNKASKIIRAIEHYFSIFNEKRTLVKLCAVMKDQHTPALRKVANDMLNELGQ